MISLRKGLPIDIPAIADLLIRSWREHYQHFLPASFLDALDQDHQIRRHERIMSKGTPYWIAENEQNELLGFASYGPSRDTDLPSRMELYTIYVDSHFHKRGIGQGLLDRVIQDLLPSIPSLSVLVMEENPFRAFYEKNGFIIKGRQHMDLDDNQIISLIYKKDLRPSTP